jgi:protein TonB
MRKVYQAPKTGSGNWLVSLCALLLTVGVFLLVPLTQMISSGANKKLLLTKADVAVPPPPPTFEPPPPPPPPEEKKEEPPPQLQDTPKPLALNFDLDVNLSGGAGILGGSLFGDGQNDAMKELAQAFDVSELDRPPTLVASVQPAYPSHLRKARVGGKVVVLFMLDEEGHVHDPRVESSTHPDFEKPVLDAIRRWKYKPGTKEGQAVRTYIRLPLSFSVNS